MHKTDHDNTAPNLGLMDTADSQSVLSNEMETYALAIPLELTDQTFEGETPLEHPNLDIRAVTLPLVAQHTLGICSVHQAQVRRGIIMIRLLRYSVVLQWLDLK
jgi:hypothetical protein